MERETSRRLRFDHEGLIGRVDEGDGTDVRVRGGQGREDDLAFAGVHVLSPEVFGLLTERGRFSILGAYLRLAALGQRILPFRVDACAWIDVGKPETLREADRLARGEGGPAGR